MLAVFTAALAASAGAAPFTLERALQEARRVDPQAALPIVELPAGVTVREDVAYATIHDVALHLELYRPAGDGPFPAVILVHGGGWESGDRAMERAFAIRLAGEGFVAVPVSYRLGPGGRFPRSLHDLKAAVRWLRAHAAEWDVEPDAIGAVGGSAGGQLVALLGATNDLARFEGDGGHPEQSSSVQAVVSIDGLADFTAAELLDQQRNSPSAPTRHLGGPFQDAPDTWRDASPLTQVGLRSAPMLFIKSDAPSPLLPGREEMSRRLSMMGIPSEVLTMEGAPHVFWLVEPWFEPTVQETVRFLKTYLDAGEPVSPAAATTR